MTYTSKTRIILGALAGAILAVGCGPKNQLEPSPQANQVANLNEAAQTTINDVHVTAQVDSWPGNEAIVAHVTPMRLIVKNQSDKPIRLTYEQLRIVASDGSDYRAIPPFQIEGSVRAAADIDYEPIPSPTFEFNDYLLSPAYSPYYPGYATWTGPWASNSLYYDQHYDVWYQQQMPTRQMLQRALPEGVIMPGGSVNGYVYFPKISDDDRRVRLVAQLMFVDSSSTPRHHATASIPFLVE